MNGAHLIGNTLFSQTQRASKIGCLFALNLVHNRSLEDSTVLRESFIHLKVFYIQDISSLYII